MPVPATGSGKVRAERRVAIDDLSLATHRHDCVDDCEALISLLGELACTETAQSGSGASELSGEHPPPLLAVRGVVLAHLEQILVPGFGDELIPILLRDLVRRLSGLDQLSNLVAARLPVTRGEMSSKYVVGRVDRTSRRPAQHHDVVEALWILESQTRRERLAAGSSSLES